VLPVAVAKLGSQQWPPIALGSAMSQIKVNPGDSFELALKRFNRKVQQDGVLSEARRRRHYETPQARRKRKAETQRRRRRRSSRYAS